MTLCNRCGEPFEPRPTRLKKLGMTRCCEKCQFRNLMDGLGLPTPPDMIDRHTRHPALTQDEYRTMMVNHQPSDD